MDSTPNVQVLDLSSSDNALLLQVAVSSGTVNLTFTGTALRPDNSITPFRIPIIKSAGAGFTNFRFPLRGAKLVTLMVTNDVGNITENSCYVTASLSVSDNNNSVTLTALFSGYVNQFVPLAYPQLPLNNFHNSTGYLARPPLANPGAGQPIIFAADSVNFQRITHISFTFTCSAVVGNRFVELWLDTAGTFIPVSGLAQIATQVIFYRMSIGNSIQFASNTMNLPLPSQSWCNPGDGMRISARGMDVGDTFTNIAAQVEKKFLI